MPPIVPQLSLFDDIKRCCTCKSVKSRSEFHNCKSEAGGLAKRCKLCAAAAVRRCFQNKSPEQKAAVTRRKREYRHANPDKVKACKDRHYAKAGPSQASRWAKAHRSQVNASRRRRYQLDPAPIKAYKQKRAEQVRVLNRRRKARLKGAEGTFSHAEWTALCARYHHRCLRCLQIKPLTIDHIVPVTQGGTNWIWNCQPLCANCNSSKRDTHHNYRPDRLLPAPSG